LPSYVWYNSRGMAAKSASANGLFQKSDYDGLGRTVNSYTSFDSDETSYADAMTITGDTVIQQSRVYYDATGRAAGQASFQRFHDDTTTTGALDPANS